LEEAAKGGKLFSLIVPASEALETDNLGACGVGSDKEITCGSTIMIK
jgi:hypothetical protein